MQSNDSKNLSHEDKLTLAKLVESTAQGLGIMLTCNITYFSLSEGKVCNILLAEKFSAEVLAKFYNIQDEFEKAENPILLGAKDETTSIVVSRLEQIMAQIHITPMSKEEFEEFESTIVNS